MGLVQSSPGRQEERPGDEKSEREPEQAASKQNKDTQDVLPGPEDDEEEEEEEEDGVPVALPITASYVPESSMRIWDPQGGPLGHMPDGSRRGSRPSGHAVGEEVCTYVYVIRCGESSVPEDVVRGRCPSAVLTPHGQRQARALGISFLSRGLRFDALLCSPTERCRQTALAVCQEIHFNQERLEFGEALMEMSNGLWEGLRKLDVYSGGIVDIKVNLNQDFHAPGGESQRQVEFRMVEYVNNVVLTRSLEMNRHSDQRVYYAKHGKEVPSTQMYMPNSDGNCNAIVKGKGKSRTHIMAPPPPGIGSLVSDDQHVPSLMRIPSTYYVALFSHEMAIKCLLRGLMAFPPSTVEQLCIDPTSITVLRHSNIFGWKIIQVNDTSHLHSV